MDASGVEEWEYVFSSIAALHKGVEMVHDGGSIYTIGGYYTDGAPATENYYLTKFDITGLNDGSSVGLATAETSDPLGLLLYPNPVAGNSLTIDLSAALPIASTYLVNVFDQQGKVVDQFELSGARITYDCARLQSGLYWIEVFSGAARTTKSFVITDQH